MSKYWSFCSENELWEIWDPKPLFKWRQMYSKSRVQDTSMGLIYRGFPTVTHLCLTLSLHSWLSCASLCMWACVLGLMSPSYLLSWALSFFLCLCFSQTGLDRPLSSHMTTHTLGSSTTPTGNTLSVQKAYTCSVANRTRGCHLPCALLFFFFFWPFSAAVLSPACDTDNNLLQRALQTLETFLIDVIWNNEFEKNAKTQHTALSSPPLCSCNR